MRPEGLQGMWTVLDEIECGGGLDGKFPEFDGRAGNICRHEHVRGHIDTRD